MRMHLTCLHDFIIMNLFNTSTYIINLQITIKIYIQYIENINLHII